MSDSLRLDEHNFVDVATVALRLVMFGLVNADYNCSQISSAQAYKPPRRPATGYPHPFVVGLRAAGNGINVIGEVDFHIYDRKWFAVDVNVTANGNKLKFYATLVPDLKLLYWKGYDPTEEQTCVYNDIRPPEVEVTQA